MKKMINWIKDYKFYFFNSLIIFIFILLGSLSNKLKVVLDNIFFISSLLIIFLIIIWIIYIIIKNKKEKNRLYKKYGYEKINKLKEYINKVSVEEPEKYYENCEWVFNVADSCYDFLEEAEELEYSKKDYEKDLKKLLNTELKEMEKYIKSSKEVMNIISIYYDNNGKRKNRE